MEKLLIAGIDPGTVGAYAIIDLEGNIIAITSGRNLTHSKIILEITRYGKVFIIGCDVAQPPNMVVKIASSIGAKVANPDHDLKYLEKIKSVDTFLKSKKEFIKLENKHEKDALVAALYGLKSIRGLLKKIQDHLKEHKKMYLYDKVKNKVLLENKPIVEAVKYFS